MLNTSSPALQQPDKATQLGSRRAVRLLLILWVLASPTLITFVQVRKQFNANLDQFLPTTYFSWQNDQVSFWRQIGTFREAGYRGG